MWTGKSLRYVTLRSSKLHCVALSLQKYDFISVLMVSVVDSSASLLCWIVGSLTLRIAVDDFGLDTESKWIDKILS